MGWLVTFGPHGSLRWRAVFLDASCHAISPWHGIRLQANAPPSASPFSRSSSTGRAIDSSLLATNPKPNPDPYPGAGLQQQVVYHMVVTTPRGTWLQAEPAHDEDHTPLRAVPSQEGGLPAHFPLNAPHPLGFLPQTWTLQGGVPEPSKQADVRGRSETPSEKSVKEGKGSQEGGVPPFVEEGQRGSRGKEIPGVAVGRPLKVVEISGQQAELGDVLRVRIVGALGVAPAARRGVEEGGQAGENASGQRGRTTGREGGEAQWTLLAVRVDGERGIESGREAGNAVHQSGGDGAIAAAGAAAAGGGGGDGPEVSRGADERGTATNSVSARMQALASPLAEPMPPPSTWPSSLQSASASAAASASPSPPPPAAAAAPVLGCIPRSPRAEQRGAFRLPHVSPSATCLPYVSPARLPGREGASPSPSSKALQAAPASPAASPPNPEFAFNPAAPGSTEGRGGAEGGGGGMGELPPAAASAGTGSQAGAGPGAGATTPVTYSSSSSITSRNCDGSSNSSNSVSTNSDSSSSSGSSSSNSSRLSSAGIQSSATEHSLHLSTSLPAVASLARVPEGMEAVGGGVGVRAVGRGVEWDESREVDRVKEWLQACLSAGSRAEGE